jgi:hypothetical protein
MLHMYQRKPFLLEEKTRALMKLLRHLLALLLLGTVFGSTGHGADITRLSWWHYDEAAPTGNGNEVACGYYTWFRVRDFTGTSLFNIELNDGGWGFHSDGRSNSHLDWFQGDAQPIATVWDLNPKPQNWGHVTTKLRTQGWHQYQLEFDHATSKLRFLWDGVLISQNIPFSGKPKSLDLVFQGFEQNRTVIDDVQIEAGALSRSISFETDVETLSIRSAQLNLLGSHGVVDWAGTTRPRTGTRAWELGETEGYGETSVASLNVAAVVAAPLITTQPTSAQIVAKGSSVTLSVTASGTGSLNYQWQKDGVDLPGKTAATLSLTNVQPQHIGYYTCRVTDSNGSTTSQQATLNLTGENFGIWQGLVAYYPFKGNAQDATAYGNNGTVSGARLAADRFGSANGCYAFNGTSDYIVVPDAPQNDLGEQFTISLWMKPGAGFGSPVFDAITGAGNVHILSKWGGGGETLASYLIGITDAGMLFLATHNPPSETTVKIAETPITVGNWLNVVVLCEESGFSVYTNGTLLFQSSTLVFPQTNSSYNLNFGREEAGNFAHYRGQLDDIRIYNRALSAEEVGQLYQAEAAFSPEITVQPEGQAVYFNQTATFSVTATGTAPLAYQWFRDGRAIPGATSATYSFKATSATRGAYSVRVSNTVGSVTSDAVPLDAAAARYTWAAESDNQRVALGGTAGFGVQDVTGPTEAVSYQWFKDGKAVSGATSATLEFNSVTLTNAGRYTLVITTAAGKETTATRVLAVEDPGLLVYSYGATTTDADPVGELTTKQMGFLVVDRANGQAALVLYGKVGSQKVRTTEGPFPLETTSTGPVPGSRTVFHVAASTEDTVDQTWFTGRDALIRLSASRSTIAPSVATGSVGRIDAGIGHSAVTLALSTGQTLATRTNAETMAAAVSRIQSELTAKGYVPAAE